MPKAASVEQEVRDELYRVMFRTIETERHRNGWTIKHMLQRARIKVSVRTYQNWRDCKKPIRIEVVCRLADVLDCSTDYLLGRSDVIRYWVSTKKVERFTDIDEMTMYDMEELQDEDYPAEDDEDEYDEYDSEAETD